MATIFQSGRITQVFFELGTFENETGKKKYVKAPFQLVRINGEVYLRPECAAVSGGGSQGAITGPDINDESFWQVREEYFHDLSNVIVGEHEMGAFSNHPDDWKGFHDFSMV